MNNFLSIMGTGLITAATTKVLKCRNPLIILKLFSVVNYYTLPY